MKIFIQEITDLDTSLDFDQEEPWVASAVARLDENLEEDGQRLSRTEARRQKNRPIQVHFSIRKVDNVVVITGKAKTSVQLLCSRCVNAFSLNCSPNFTTLFCKDPVMAGVAHLQEHKDPEDGAVTLRPMGQNRGYARHAHDENAEEDEATGKDLDITYISEDFIDLADVLTEQLRLQIPFQPLCKGECKGICAQCGADLNVGRCACAKLTSHRPFSVLKDLKIQNS